MARKRRTADPMLTCTQVAIWMGVTPQTVSNWIRGRILRGVWVQNEHMNRVMGAKLSQVREAFPHAFTEEDTDAVVMEKIEAAQKAPVTSTV